MPVARYYPALDVSWPSPPSVDVVDRLMADLDECRPHAVEDLPAGVRVFFAGVEDRDRAVAVVRNGYSGVDVSIHEVSDEAWAERSQAAIGPVQVGNFIVAPPWSNAASAGPMSVITIQPSMGFGTGHHASTRLCLQLLQDVPLAGRSVLDVGTGSGVLAIAAWKLGAAPVVGIDVDDDALASAKENLELNGADGAVTLEALDVMVERVERGEKGAPRFPDGHFDVITANLTGALLARAGETFARLLAAGGSLIASGFQTDEADGLTRSLGRAGFSLDAAANEDGWEAVRLRRTEVGGEKPEVRSQKLEVIGLDE